MITTTYTIKVQSSIIKVSIFSLKFHLIFVT